MKIHFVKSWERERLVTLIDLSIFVTPELFWPMSYEIKNKILWTIWFWVDNMLKLIHIQKGPGLRNKTWFYHWTWPYFEEFRCFIALGVFHLQKVMKLKNVSFVVFLFFFEKCSPAFYRVKIHFVKLGYIVTPELFWPMSYEIKNKIGQYDSGLTTCSIIHIQSILGVVWRKERCFLWDIEVMMCVWG